MSSPDAPDGGDRPTEPTAEELTGSPGAQAEIERTDADPGVDAEAATPGDPTTAADRGGIEAPGAPGEPSSDADASSAPAPTPEPAPADEGAPESGGGATSAAGTPTDAEGAPRPGSDSSVVADQPAPTPSAAADASVGEQAAAAEADKEAQARAAAEVVAKAKQAEAAAAAAEAAEAEAEPVEVDERRQPLIDTLRRHLGDDVVETHVVPGVDVWVRVRPTAWRRAGEICRNELGLTYFGYVSAIDWMPSPLGKSEETNALEGPGAVLGGAEAQGPFEHGTTGGDTRFQLIARLQSVTTGLGIHLKADVPDDNLQVESWTPVFPGADWHERETAEMFGIRFLGHPNLVHIYLPGEFEGHPLRKDFPLLAREVKPWPGLVDVEPMPGDDEPAPSEAGADA